MQLIMDAEDTSVDIREKMSTLDQESLSDKPVLNGIQDPECDAPNGNKENIETKNNIIDNVNLDNEIKLVDEAVISSSVTEESGDDNKTEDKGSDEQVPDKGDANIEEKSIEDIVAEMDSFDDKENTSEQKAKEIEKEEKSVIDVCAALEDVTEETSRIDVPRETDCNKTDQKERLSKEKEPVPDNEEQKDLEEKFKLTEKTGIDEKNYIKKQQENNTVVENAEIDKDNVNTDKSEDNVFENKVEVIADEKDDNTVTDQHLEKEVEEEKENVLVQDVNLIVDNSVNNTENESDNNETVQNNLEKTDSKTEEISLDNGDSNIDEIEKTEPMETSQLSDISCNEVISSEINSSVVSSENEEKAPNTMDCDEKPTDKTEELAQTADSSDNTSEIVTNGIETYTNDFKNLEEPMECKQISEVSTSENADDSTTAGDGEVVNTSKIEKSKNENLSEKQSDSVKFENEAEAKTTGDCGITDPTQPICDKKDEESNSMECNDIMQYVPEAEKNAIITTSQETTDQIEPICNKKDVESNAMECNDIIEVREAEKKNEINTTSQETTDQVEPICNKTDVESNSMECNDIIEVPEAETKNEIIKTPSESKAEILDVDEIKEITEDEKEEPVKADSVVKNQEAIQKEPEPKPVPSTPTIKLSNTLDILSDDEDEPPKASETPKPADDKCIDIEDDDDIMLIDDVDDTNSKDGKKITDVIPEVAKENETKTDQNTINIEDLKDNKSVEESVGSPKTELDTDAVEPVKPEVYDKAQEEPPEKIEKPKPLVPEDFFKSYRKDLAYMTRDDLEEFCIIKIVESIIDRSSLNEIRSKLKTMAQSIDEYKKKTLMLTKQNRDLQVVLKSVQEEQKKVSDTQITPLKITRSVGMQVYMTEKNTKRKVIPTVTNLNVRNSRTRPPNTNTIPRPQKTVNNQQIPVPRLVPANNITVSKASNLPPSVPNIGKVTSPLPNGIKNSTPPPKAAEKRPHNRIQSDTVDLTDDEPPAKITSRNPTPAPPVRLVSPQNLLATRQPFPQSGSFNSPRKVYIPISGPQAQVRPGQTIMLKSVPSSGPRQRGPAPMVRMPQNSVRMQRVQNNRHPAPLPDAMKQYQPPNWKALPPAPDLKLSKVENGIVISWKIDGYQEDSYEEIASYQLYAYQETTSPPNTSLWKKIGDVKALPLPMACTLTQFMAGYKYFFAVRAVDIRSRLGPFSLPGSILLLNKM